MRNRNTINAKIKKGILRSIVAIIPAINGDKAEPIPTILSNNPAFAPFFSFSYFNINSNETRYVLPTKKPIIKRIIETEIGG